MEDAQIVEYYLMRDEAAIRYTAERYGAQLRALAFHITADRMTAEECENDTYLEAWNLIPPHSPKTYFYAFLVRILRHIAIDRCRARASLKRSGLVMELTEELNLCLPAAHDVDSVLDEKLLGETIGRFLGTLPQEKRIMFMRRYFYLDSVSEIAERLNITESNVKTTLFRIRKSLKSYLEKEGFEI